MLNCSAICFNGCNEAWSLILNHFINTNLYNGRINWLCNCLRKLIALSKNTRLLKDTIKVIFTTAYSQYAIQGYEFNVIDYLLKPIAFERFLKAVNKLALKQPQEVIPETIRINNIHKPVDPKDIVFVESVGNYVKITFKTSNIVIHSTLKDICDVLEPYGFIRCHKRYIINHTSIITAENDKITLSNKKEIPIGISYRQQVKLVLKDFGTL